MENYELAMSDGGETEFYYEFNRDELKNRLNSIIKNNKLINKSMEDDSDER